MVLFRQKDDCLLQLWRRIPTIYPDSRRVLGRWVLRYFRNGDRERHHRMDRAERQRHWRGEGHGQLCREQGLDAGRGIRVAAVPDALRRRFLRFSRSGSQLLADHLSERERDLGLRLHNGFVASAGILEPSDRDLFEAPDDLSHLQLREAPRGRPAEWEHLPSGNRSVYGLRESNQGDAEKPDDFGRKQVDLL